VEGEPSVDLIIVVPVKERKDGPKHPLPKGERRGGGERFGGFGYNHVEGREGGHIACIEEDRCARG